MNESYRHNVGWKPDTRREHTALFHLFKVNKQKLKNKKQAKLCC